MPREDREPDELFEIRTNFYTGNYQQTINEATKLKVSHGIRFFRLFFCRRSNSGATESPNREGSVHVPFVHRAEEIRCRARRNSPIVGSGGTRGRSFTRRIPFQ